MSQIEQDFRIFLSRHPEIEKSYQEGLINRRALARYLVEKGLIKNNQLEAAIAMIRRNEFPKKQEGVKKIFQGVRVTIKDNILILDFEKDKNLIKKLQTIISHTDYDKGDTLKIVIGSSSIKVFIDQDKEKKLADIFKEFKVNSRLKNISELSLLFSPEAIKERGIISTITRELMLNDVIISEILTASPELLIYLKEDYVVKAYEIIKRL